MVFSSVIFLCFFLPVVLLVYHIAPGIKAKNAVLTVASLLFYAYGEPLFVFYLLFLVLLHYCAGKLAFKRETYPKALFVLLLIVDVFTLFFFKYFTFVIGSINGLFHISLPVIRLSLPIGISFFTFQIMSYAIDSYRDKSLIQTRFSDLLLYISFFPQLIAGPIVKYGDIASQLQERRASSEQMAEGFRRFVIGLSKKVMISNVMAAAVDTVFSFERGSITSPEAWLACIAYSLQIYYDFSGYSDMAIGMGKMFGFTFPENFNYPYSALSITDFWKRWHISLTSWFREYVYIPLGGNRRGMPRTVLNIFIIYLLTGIWHGANYTFIVWGLYFAFFMITERLNIIPVKKIKNKPILWLYSTFVVFVGFLIFRAETVSRAWEMIRALFRFGGMSVSAFARITPMFDAYFILIAVIAVIGCFPIGKRVWEKVKDRQCISPLSYLLGAALAVVCTVMLVTDSYNPFIYFNF